MGNDTLEKLIWALIYGGLLVACLGLFVKRGDVHVGWLMIAGGAAAAVVGAVFIYLRSRRP